jgi:hypothetical protein
MKPRSIAKMFVLEIVTFGIYRLYWFIKTRRELMTKTGIKIPSVWFLLAPILMIVAVVGVFIAIIAGNSGNIRAYDTCMTDRGYPSTSSSSSSYSAYQDSAGRNIAQNVCRKQYPVPLWVSFAPTLLIVVISITYLPLMAWWLWHYCEALEIVTNEKVSRPLGMILFLVVPDGIDILIVQDYFNKVPQAQGVPTA